MRYVYIIEDTEEGGVAVSLEGDGTPGEDPTPAGLVAIAIDTLLQNTLGECEIEDVDGG